MSENLIKIEIAECKRVNNRKRIKMRFRNRLNEYTQYFDPKVAKAMAQQILINVAMIEAEEYE